MISNREELCSKYERIYLENGHCDLGDGNEEERMDDCKDGSFIRKRMDEWVKHKNVEGNKGEDNNMNKRLVTLNKLKKEIEKVMMMDIKNYNKEKGNNSCIEEKKDSNSEIKNKTKDKKKGNIKPKGNRNENNDNHKKEVVKNKHKPKVSSAIYIRDNIKISKKNVIKSNKTKDNGDNNENDQSINLSLKSYLSNNISDYKYRDKMHTSFSGLDLGIPSIPNNDKEQTHPYSKEHIPNEDNDSTKLLKAKELNRNRINKNTANIKQSVITTYSTKPLQSVISTGVNIVKLNKKLKPFNLSKSSIDNINYNKTVNAPTLLMNDISFKEEINEILELNLPIVHSNKNIIDNRLFNNKSQSLQLAATPPIDLSKFGPFMTTLYKAEDSMKNYLINFIGNYLTKLNKKCSSCHGKISELYSLWEELFISYIVRKKILDILLSKQRNQIETMIDYEISELLRFNKDNHWLYELINQREELRKKVLHNAERKNLIDLNKKIENQLRIKEKEGKYDIVWKGMKYDWVMKYDVYTQMQYNAGQ